MSNIILGEKARENHGLRDKYPEILNPVYKGYIDQLELDMIRCVYDKSDTADCMIHGTFDLDLSQEILDNGITDSDFKELEIPILNFCNKHKCYVYIIRQGLKTINVTIDLKRPFDYTIVD
jgi:hypothetical protein